MCSTNSIIRSLLYNDCANRAGRRFTVFTNENDLASLADRNQELPALLLHCIGLRVACTVVDVIPAADLGMTAGIIGNVFWETILRRNWGACNQGGNVILLAKDHKSWHRATKCKSMLQGRLTKERIRPNGKFPKTQDQQSCDQTPC